MWILRLLGVLVLVAVAGGFVSVGIALLIVKMKKGMGL